METSTASRDVRMWNVLCHATALAGFFVPWAGHILGPLIIWLAKRGDSPEIDEHGKESLNFQISMLIYNVIAGVLCSGPDRFCDPRHPAHSKSGARDRCLYSGERGKVLSLSDHDSADQVSSDSRHRERSRRIPLAILSTSFAGFFDFTSLHSEYANIALIPPIAAASLDLSRPRVSPFPSVFPALSGFCGNGGHA